MSTTSLFQPALVSEAVKQACVKLDPRIMFRNPVMFTVEIGMGVLLLVALGLLVDPDPAQGSFGYNFTVFVVLLLTLLFANFAEAIAEARGKAQAESLRKTCEETPARSAVDYNAASSAGSNKGPGNPEYLAAVKARLDMFLGQNPGVPAAQVPAELLTASGSGLDPHLSPAAVQVARVARARGLAAQQVQALVAQHTAGGVFGPATVSVLRLNIALGQLTRR